tara:strand:+ start:834 stop:1157 length:324 start_codon:yes stop_codon:yes gene_type:complete
MIIYVDIDETICVNNSERDYSKATPIVENIKKINSLYDKGHYIFFWSARGSGTGINHYELTKSQFKEWGVKYHGLSLGEKPIFDVLIDDKVINIKDLVSNKNIEEQI